MNFSLFTNFNLKNNRPQIITALFYASIALAVVIVICYGIFLFKAYLINQKITEVDKKIAVYGTIEQRNSEQKVFTYKKKIDSFSQVIATHRITTGVFNFIEQHTVPSLWFSSFGLLEERNELDLSGETENLETLSSQLNAFENNKEYVANASLLNSQVTGQGKVSFVMTLILNPKIFTYKADASQAPSTTPNSTPAPPLTPNSVNSQ